MNNTLTVFSEAFFGRFREVFEPYLSSVGISKKVLERPDVEIPEEKYIALWEAVGRSKPDIGLEIGMKTLADDFGALGHAIHCAPSVGKALETLHQFIVVFAQKTNISFKVNSRYVEVEYQISDPSIVYRRQDAEFGVAAILRQLQLITNETVEPLRVDFEHEKPADISAHKKVFACPLNFNQATNRLVFSQHILKIPVIRGNERLYRALEPFLEREREERDSSDELLPQISRMIAEELSSGVPSLVSISEQLCLSCRTLQRRLKEEGLEFSSLVEDVRRELALSYVSDSHFSLTEVAMLLGYSESGSFGRAFRRWTGVTPQRYRQIAKKD